MPGYSGRGRQRGRGARPEHRSRKKRQESKSDFSASRTKETTEDREDEAFSSEDFDDLSQEVDRDIQPSDEEDGNDDVSAAQSYATLLKALKPRQQQLERPTKRRKLASDHSKGIETADTGEAVKGATPVEGEQIDSAAAGLDEVVADEDEMHDEQDSDDEDFILSDPFEAHFSKVTEQDLLTAIEQQQSKPSVSKSMPTATTRKLKSTFGTPGVNAHKKKSGQLSIKRRLASTGEQIRQGMLEPEQDLLQEAFSYSDVLFACRNPQNSSQLRDITSLHTLNHIFKTRDRVLKNNAKLAQDASGDCRDQGFTRPKVLLLLPTKQTCVRYIESIVKLSEPDQQENKGRFLDTFSQPDGDTFQYKPDDFKDLFAGNHEEDFRVGLKFTRKSIKFFSGFYNSDIILASPLGLMRTITTGGGDKKAGKKGHDADFLSSIEIVIMDNTNALEMQNWQHADYVFSQLNLLPKDSHGCDFNRARHWYLDGNAKYLRQTIILSDYLTPAISALASTHMHNIAGRAKYTGVYEGAMLKIPASLPMSLTQTFLRFDSRSPQTDPDARFKYFTTTILPPLLRSSNKASSKGTLIYIPAYHDFVRLRNHFSTATETTSLAFGAVSEYSSKGDVARSRSHFINGRQSIMLYSERAHHYFRYKLKGVRRLIFYGLPENPMFWTEMIEALGSSAQSDAEWAQSQRGKQGKGLVRAMFSKWDVMKLERIVGSNRVAKLVSEREGDVFDFV